MVNTSKCSQCLDEPTNQCSTVRVFAAHKHKVHVLNRIGHEVIKLRKKENVTITTLERSGSVVECLTRD